MPRGKIKAKKKDDEEYQNQLKNFTERFDAEFHKTGLSQKK